MYSTIGFVGAQVYVEEVSDGQVLALNPPQRVLSIHMGYTYPNHKGNYFYRNHTLYHIGTLDPLGSKP